MNVLACNENITAGLECPGGWVATVHAQPFDITALNPEVALQYFGAGFIVPVVPLTAALGVAIILKFLKG